VAATLLWAAFALGAHPSRQTLLMATLVGIAVAIVLGVPAATIAEREAGRTDPGFVVIDEVAGQWIALLFCPPDWAHALIALILFRLLDITKPFPVRRIERLPAGWASSSTTWGRAVCFGYSVSGAHLVLEAHQSNAPRLLPTAFAAVPAPRIDQVNPAAAMPLAEVELAGANLGPHDFGTPVVLVDGEPAHILMSRPSRLLFRVPEKATTGLVEVRNPAGAGNTVPLRVAHQLTEGLHPVTSPP